MTLTTTLASLRAAGACEPGLAILIASLPPGWAGAAAWDAEIAAQATIVRRYLEADRA